VSKRLCSKRHPQNALLTKDEEFMG